MGSPQEKVVMIASLLCTVPLLFPSADLDLTLMSNGLTEVAAAPGETIDYEVRAVLSDIDNDGLAMFYFDLVFSGGELLPADAPSGTPGSGNPMPLFAIPLGYTNPAGFGGVAVDGRLVQVGGAQTISQGRSPGTGRFCLRRRVS